LVTSGGVGIAKNVYIGGSLIVANVNINDIDNYQNTLLLSLSGSIFANGGMKQYLNNDLGYQGQYTIFKKKLMIHERWNGTGYSVPSGYLHIVQDISKNGNTYKTSGFNITNVASLYPVTTIALRNTYAWERAQLGITFDMLGATGYSMGINNLNNTTNTTSKFTINNDVGFSGSDMVTIDNDTNFTHRALVGISNPNPQFTMDISGTTRTHGFFASSGINCKSLGIGTVNATTANFYTFPENGCYFIMMSYAGGTGSSSSTISTSDNLTRVYMVLVCDGYPAQVGACLAGNANYFSLGNGSTYKSISITVIQGGYTYTYYTQKLF
jgi:hypothetical protein